MTRRRLPRSNDVGQLIPSTGLEAHLIAQEPIGHDSPREMIIGAQPADLWAEHQARHRRGYRHALWSQS